MTKTKPDGIEKAAQWHEEQARVCRSIAAVNADNDLESDSTTHAIDHDIAAEEIRALTRPTPDRSEARERIAETIRQWTSHSYMQLHAGEMTAQERRTVTAVVEAIERQVCAILATGLVQDEASIRADEREKCAHIFEVRRNLSAADAEIAAAVRKGGSK